MHKFFATVLACVGLLMLAVAPITYKQLAAYGDGAVEVQAEARALVTGPAIGTSPGAYYTSVWFDFTQPGGAPGEVLVHGFVDAPTVGDVLTLRYPAGHPDEARLPVSATEWFEELGLFVIAAFLLLGLAVWARRADEPAAPLHARYGPAMTVLGLLLAGHTPALVAVALDDEMQRTRFIPTVGVVTGNSRCGSLQGGRSSRPLYCAVVEYEVADARYETSTRSYTSTFPVGTRLGVRYQPDRPSFAVVDQRSPVSAALGIIVAMVVAEFALLLAVVLHATRGWASKRQRI